MKYTVQGKFVQDGCTEFYADNDEHARLILKRSKLSPPGNWKTEDRYFIPEFSTLEKLEQTGAQ